MKCPTKLILIVLSILLLIQFLYQISQSDSEQNVPSATSNFDKAVKLISQIHSNYSSVNGLRYRSLICTIVRNDPHILEFLLRNLISGFSHIVVYDNNRIGADYDMNISNLLAPFIAAGVVTHIPWHQESLELLPNGNKNDNSAQCLQKYGMQADWVAILDSDEYFYYETRNVAVNTLNDLLVKLEEQSFCAITVLWTMMYGEGRMLKQNKTLFESYPRVCETVGQHKVLARPQLTDIDIPHIAKCKTDNHTVTTWISDKTSKIALVHYYSKSMEEFLIKGDQSIPPYTRRPIQSYRDSGSICRHDTFLYSRNYRRTFMNVYKQFQMFYSSEPITLSPPPLLNLKHMPDHHQGDADYTLFIYLKYRVARREEFDQERYLSINPDAKQAIKNGTANDGLHHFMLNYANGVKGCWKTNTYSICE